MKDLTSREIIELIDRSLKETAEDVRLSRVPLDGRFRPIYESEVKAENLESQTSLDKPAYPPAPSDFGAGLTT